MKLKLLKKNSKFPFLLSLYHNNLRESFEFDTISESRFLPLGAESLGNGKIDVATAKMGSYFHCIGFSMLLKFSAIHHRSS